MSAINPQFHVILFQPEIPQNTGNIGRLCAITNSRLHLIHPLGFEITDSKIRRSGMDYWYDLDVVHHADWDAFLKSDQAPARLWLFTTKAEQSYWDVTYSHGDGFLFGNEGHGCPPYVHEYIGDHAVTIPQSNRRMRSHNLANSAALAVYEGLRQVRSL